MSIPRNKFWITVTFATATKPKILFWRMLWVPGPHHSREKTPKDTWDPQPGPINGPCWFLDVLGTWLPNGKSDTVILFLYGFGKFQKNSVATIFHFWILYDLMRLTL